MQPTAADYLAKSRALLQDAWELRAALVLVGLVLTVVAWCRVRDWWRDR